MNWYTPSVSPRYSTAPKINPDNILHWWNDLEGTMTHGTNEDRRAVVRGFVKDVSIDPVAKQVEVTLWRWEPGPYLPAGGSPEGNNGTVSTFGPRIRCPGTDGDPGIVAAVAFRHRMDGHNTHLDRTLRLLRVAYC